MARKSLRGRRPLYGWAFVAPAILIIGCSSCSRSCSPYVSFSDWNGLGSPLGNSEIIGTDNYAAILAEEGLAQRTFGTSIRNNLYYVIAVVPLQTALSLFLAVQVNRRLLRARGFFRTAFYFPSVTSPIAITTIFIFLFSATGAVNSVIKWLGGQGPNWFADPRGLLHILLEPLGVSGSGPLGAMGPLGISWYQWIAGPSGAVRHHHPRGVHHLGDVHAAVHRGAAEHLGRGRRGGAHGRRGPFRTFFSVTMPLLAHDLHGPHPRPDRHLAGLRPDLPDGRRRRATPPSPPRTWPT